MSMNRYANAGPIMAGLAAMSASPEAETMAFVRECFRQIGEIAQQIEDIRKRLDELDRQGGWLDRDAWQSQLQAQQAATAQQAVESDYYRTSMAGLSELCNAAYGVSAAGKGHSST